MIRRAALLTSAVVLAGSAPAAAQTPATPPVPAAPPAGTTPATPVPVPAPAAGRLTVRLERVGGARATILAGDRIRVRGTLTPYVAGQRVTVRLYRGIRRVAKRTVKVRRTGSRGTFMLALRSRGAGAQTVRATHLATSELVMLKARSRAVSVLPRHVDGSSGATAVRALQRRLSVAGYVVGEAGRLDARTARAVLAFRKVSGMARTTAVTETVMRRLARGGGRFHVRFPSQGKHVEANLSLQVLALIAGRRVQRIYPISSGKPSTPTILGTFHVYSKTPGTNAKGMVYTSYFQGGYGIHGYAEVPIYAASHGCLRVPVPDAVPIYDWISYGDAVDVYR